MKRVVVTGSGGLVGAEAARMFHSEGWEVLGIDNDMRKEFFGDEASTAWQVEKLKEELSNYSHFQFDIRNAVNINTLFCDRGVVDAVIHCAAQPSHDWAAQDPRTDFEVNALGTLNMLEAVRQHCPEAPFVFTSTNKVYGDTPNRMTLGETDTRFELLHGHPWHEKGIDETMSIDQCKHSVFGASKVAADIMVQEYGRYFGMNTGVFRGGCLTGPGHSGAKLHGFLSYLGKCAVRGLPYTVLGHGGKQVRDNIHASDLVEMFVSFVDNPKSGEVYNAGGGRANSCSVLEAISAFESITGRSMNIEHNPVPRDGDHQWWISDTTKFENHYPGWKIKVPLEKIYQEIAKSFERREKR